MKPVNDMTDRELHDLISTIVLDFTEDQMRLMLARFAGADPEAFDRALAAVKAGDAG